MFSPTENDRERLEVLHEELNDKIDTECYVYHHDADALQLGVRLQDVSPKSKLARRMNLDTRFAVLARQVAELIESPDDAAEVIEAARLLGEMRYGERGESAAKAVLDAHAEVE